MTVASRYWTLTELIDKVREDLDLQEETFVSDNELTTSCNEAIDRLEQEVHALYEDYFLTPIVLTLTSGVERYPLPDGIYAHKIRRVLYINGSRVYTVHRLGDWKKFEVKAIQNINNTSTLYSYFLVNQFVGVPELAFIPVPIDTGPVITIWYLRQANRLEIGSDILDIPEAANYVLQYMKTRVYEKEHNPMLQKAMSDIEKERELFVGILAAMIPDAENNIEPDFTFYEEMS